MKNNINFLTELSVKYNVEFQPLYSADAIKKGNLERVHKALIGGQEYNKLGNMKKSELEDIFKAVACGRKADTGITFRGNSVYVYGNRYNVLDIIRGIKVGKLLDILDESKKNARFYAICEWLSDDANRREYLKTVNGDFWSGYLALEHYFRHTEIKTDLDELVETWIELADELADDEGVELLDYDEDDDLSDLVYPVGV